MKARLISEWLMFVVKYFHRVKIGNVFKFANLQFASSTISRPPPPPKKKKAFFVPDMTPQMCRNTNILVFCNPATLYLRVCVCVCTLPPSSRRRKG